MNLIKYMSNFKTSSTLDEMGADALLCLAATGSREESLAQ